MLSWTGRALAIHVRAGRRRGLATSGGEALAPVVQATDLGKLNDLVHGGRALPPGLGRILVQRQVRPRPVVVGTFGSIWVRGWGTCASTG
jgi:hypothetical protein